MNTIYELPNGKFVAHELGDKRARTMRTLSTLLTGLRRVRCNQFNTEYLVQFETMGWRVIDPKEPPYPDVIGGMDEYGHLYE
jgi:hypothetical protein